MTTEQVYVKNDGTGMDEALQLTEKFADYNGIPEKVQLHIRLLTEETLGMVRVIAGNFRALFWLEGDSHSCSIHLQAKTDMDPDKRRELLAVSSSGKNYEARGFMGKIRELIETGIENYQEAENLKTEYGVGTVGYGAMGIDPADAMSQAVMTWSLERYRMRVESGRDEDEAEEEAWDELEKSIVANIADDVRVGIRKDRVEMVIYKKF